MDQRRSKNVGSSGDTSNMRSKTVAAEREQIEARDRKYRQGWEGGYDSGYQDAYAEALKDPMTFCVCKSGERCKFVEDVADGHADTCWYCTFIAGLIRVHAVVNSPNEEKER